MKCSTRTNDKVLEIGLTKDQFSARCRNSSPWVLSPTACVVFAWMIAAAGCGDTTEESKSDTDTGNTDAGDNTDGDNTDSDTASLYCGVPDTELVEGDANELFDWPYVPTFDIYLPPDMWEQLQIDARDEEYTEATACFEGRGIGTVGLRFKGNIGSLYSCFNAKDENTCRKLGMKLKFSEYDKEGRFFGLKRLNFQGNRYDDTYMRETLAYDIFREADITAPRAAWAQVRVNDELMGLYGMVEQIDGRFTKDRRPDDGDGNLYKEVWPIVTDEQTIISHLKTNEDDPDVSALIAFSTAMNDAKPEDLRDTLGEYMDLDYLARYMVVDDAIANFDGITAYYTAEDATWAGNHNFYLYEEAPKAYTMIPWDLESTFQPTTFGYLPHWTTIPEDCDRTYNAWGDDSLHVIAPGCDRIFQAMAQDLTSYETYGRTFLDEIFTEKKILDRMDDYAAFIKDAVEADPNGPGWKVFQQSFEYQKELIPILRLRLEALLKGETLDPLVITVDKINDFETQTDTGVQMGSSIYAGPASSAEIGINDETPLEGERSLHFAFEHANGGEAWDQWSTFIVPFQTAPKDLSELTGIRLTLRAEKPRIFTVSIDSAFATEKDGYLRPGWDIDITDEAAQYEVRFEDLVYPWWAEELYGITPASTVEQVLPAARGLQFQPLLAGVDEDGFLPEGTTDKGSVDIDDIEFF